jgi:hypothetical protein
MSAAVLLITSRRPHQPTMATRAGTTPTAMVALTMATTAQTTVAQTAATMVATLAAGATEVGAAGAAGPSPSKGRLAMRLHGGGPVDRLHLHQHVMLRKHCYATMLGLSVHAVLSLCGVLHHVAQCATCCGC